MIGAIVGDILGSTFEHTSAPARDVPLFRNGSTFTDDTVCTIAICEGMLDGSDPAACLRRWASRYPNAGYGASFRLWARQPGAPPYQSFANGALMRVSPAIALAASQEEALAAAHAATAVTHDHEIALRAVHHYAQALWAALTGGGHDAVCALIEAGGYRAHDVELFRRERRVRLRADETLEDVLSCLRQATDFESLMRECLYHGGDTDTICAIAGPLGEALWGIPEHVRHPALGCLPADIARIVEREYARMTTLARRA